MIAAIAAKIFSNRYYHMETTLLLLSQDRLSSISTIVAITSRLSEASLIFFSGNLVLTTGLKT